MWIWLQARSAVARGELPWVEPRTACRHGTEREACIITWAQSRAWEAFRTTLTGMYNTPQANSNLHFVASIPQSTLFQNFRCPWFSFRWASNTFSIRGGKPLWVDPFDQHVQHIFIDDNIRQNDEDTIVNPKVPSLLLKGRQHGYISCYWQL